VDSSKAAGTQAQQEKRQPATNPQGGYFSLPNDTSDIRSEMLLTKCPSGEPPMGGAAAKQNWFAHTRPTTSDLQNLAHGQKICRNRTSSPKPGSATTAAPCTSPKIPLRKAANRNCLREGTYANHTQTASWTSRLRTCPSFLASPNPATTLQPPGRARNAGNLCFPDNRSRRAHPAERSQPAKTPGIRSGVTLAKLPALTPALAALGRHPSDRTREAIDQI